MDYSFGVVELKYEKGKLMIVKTEWIIDLKPKYSKTQDFFCYWSPDFNDSPELKDCGYSKIFTGLPSLFKVFIVHLTSSIEEAQKILQNEGRMKMVAKRFREPGDTEEEIKKIETKKKRNAKKELKGQKAEAHAQNSDYLLSNIPILSANGVNRKKETQEMQSELPTMSKSIPIAQVPIGLTSNDSFDKLACEFVNEIINEDSQNQDANSTLVLESVETKEIGPVEEQWDQLSPSEIICLLSNEDNFELNDMPVVQMSVQQPSADLGSCSSYEEYVEVIMNGHGQLNLIEDISETEERHEDSNNDELEVIHVANDSVLMMDLEKSNNNKSEAITVRSTSVTMIDGQNVVTLNFDELKDENRELKKENETLKKDLENANRRNLLLQNYLVAADERLGQTIFIEKDGGRLYRGGVFLNKNQCAVLDKSKNDREFLNNLVTSIFGRKVLETSSITGAPSNRMKGKNIKESSSDLSVAAANENPKQKLKLDSDLLQLTYDIMDARSVMNKTEKLTKTAKNAIIGKKCTNTAAAADMAATKTKNNSG